MAAKVKTSGGEELDGEVRSLLERYDEADQRFLLSLRLWLCGPE